MKVSNFIVAKQVGDDYILFSTISKKIIKVSKEFYSEMNDLDEQNLKVIKLNELQFLLDSYFVIEDNVDEKRIVEAALDIDRLHQEIFSSYIAFSTLCNFACVYCYEECQTERKFVMNQDILKKQSSGTSLF